MASLVEDLMTVLEEETGCYQLLLEMANNKKDVIINGDLPSLQEMTKQEQELAGLLLRLEKKREEIIKDICLVTNKNPEEITMTKLVGYLAGQDAEQKKLATVVEGLTKVVLPLGQANKTNQQLLEQSLEFVDFTMNALQSSREPVNNSTYQAKGKGYGVASQGKGKNFFDAKQ